MGRRSRLALSNPFPSPISVWAGLKSLGGNSMRHKKGTSSSTITVQAPKHQHPPPPSRLHLPQKTKKLSEALKKSRSKNRRTRRTRPKTARITTNDDQRRFGSRERKGSERGRRWPLTSSSVPSLAPGGYRHRNDTLSIRSNSTSRSVSSDSSPQGSIPDIPSPSTYGGGRVHRSDDVASICRQFIV
jgi:hypothetical protein